MHLFFVVRLFCLSMRNSIASSIVMLMLTLPASAHDAASVVALYQRAIGDAAKLRSMRSWSLSGKISSADGSWKRTFRAWFDGMKTRTEMVLQPGIVATTWTDGHNGWSIQPWTQSLVPQPLNQSSRWRLQIMAQPWRNDLLDPAAKLEYLGTEELDGSDCYKLQSRHRDGSIWTYFVDPDLGLLVKLSVEALINGEEVQWNATFGNYERIEGILLPMVLDTSTGLLLVDRYELNPTLDAGMFAPPTK